MIETFKKTLMAGLGALTVTKDKVQNSLDEFVRQGKITAADARAIAEKIADDGRREFEEVSAKVGGKVRDVAAYFQRLDDLEARVAALEQKTAKGPKSRAKP